MSEKLIIRNFGPIENVELDLRKFNVIIGENATGKSTIAKVLAVCRYFSFIIDSDKFYFSGSTSPFIQGLSLRGLGQFLKEDSYIFYECKHYSFLFQKYLGNVKVVDENGNSKTTGSTSVGTTKLTPISPEFKNLLLELEKISPKPDIKGDYTTEDLSWTIPTSFYQNDVASVLDNPFYLPTERGLQSIFSLGKDSIQNISDSLFNELANLDLVAKIFKNETLIEPFNVVYKNIDGRGYIKRNNEEQFYSLNNGASGYQSTIPIVLVIKYYNQIRKKKKTFLVEEPELNLFPIAQNELVKFLGDNIFNFGNTIIITTHSPYILTSLNNLMYAYQAGQNHESEIDKIVPKKYWINPTDVSAYMLLPNGKCESILDKEGLIKTAKIDEVSGLLNKDFNEMFDIELAIKK